MADGRHLEKLKNGHISATVRPIGMKFGLVTHIGPPNRMGSKNFNFSKSKMAHLPPFWKIGKGHISATVHSVNTKFGMLMHSGPANRSSSQNFQLLKIQDGGRRHLKNWKTAMTPQRFDRSALNFAWWCILDFRTGPSVEISHFLKSKMENSRHLKLKAVVNS